MKPRLPLPGGAFAGSRREASAFPRSGVIATLRLEANFSSASIVCFLFFFAVFFVNQILLMAEDILSSKAQFKDVMLLLIYALPSVIAMSFPFASLVGALMAAGRLSSDNEMLAVMAAGIPRGAPSIPSSSWASSSRSYPSR
jgi:hypothetical protein